VVYLKGLFFRRFRVFNLGDSLGAMSFSDLKESPRVFLTTGNHPRELVIRAMNQLDISKDPH
ncbi:MAG: hypothetical protein ACREX3_20465, partial [Gammaproteobacteria bacterium]